MANGVICPGSGRFAANHNSAWQPSKLQVSKEAFLALVLQLFDSIHPSVVLNALYCV